MAFRSAKLIVLPCCAVVALLVSFIGAQASSCLPSAAAVKREYPGTWPSWTLRHHSPDGSKCWHPGTQASAHGHRFRIVHPQYPIAAPKHIAASIEGGPNRSLSTAPDETSGTGWNPQDRADAASVPMPVPERSSFAERFAAVFE